MTLNKALIIGNLTRDPETRSTPSGINVVTFGVATNMVWTDASGQRQEKVEFHNIVAWRKLGEICAQYLHKGSKIFAEGRLQTRDWVGQDGVKRYRTEIVLENMIMLDRAGQGGAQRPAQPLATASEPVIDYSEQNASVSPSPSASEEYNEEEIKVENIPF